MIRRLIHSRHGEAVKDLHKLVTIKHALQLSLKSLIINITNYDNKIKIILTSLL